MSVGRNGPILETHGVPLTQRPKLRRRFLKTLRDAFLAASAFTLISGPMVCGPSIAGPHGPTVATAAVPPAPLTNRALAVDEPAALVQVATASSATSPDTVYKRTSAQAAWLLLTLAFSLITALNLATFRHLRRAYARPVRRGDRRKPFGKGVGG
ncbi:MAG: hypothetical protein ACKVP4_12545 [Hyphomicrobium sp.]